MKTAKTLSAKTKQRIEDALAATGYRGTWTSTTSGDRSGLDPRIIAAVPNGYDLVALNATLPTGWHAWWLGGGEWGYTSIVINQRRPAKHTVIG